MGGPDQPVLAEEVGCPALFNFVWPDFPETLEVCDDRCDDQVFGLLGELGLGEAGPGTYLTGQVTSSGAMLVRIERTAEAARAEVDRTPTERR